MKLPTIENIIKDDSKILPCLFDLCFKEIFGNSEHPEIIEYLMATLLSVPIYEIEGKITFLDSTRKGKRIAEKNGDKDITFLLDLDICYKITLEANLRSKKNQTILDRNLYQVANLFGQGVKRGDDYNTIRMTYQYNFNNYSVDKENPHSEILDEYSMRNDYGNMISEKLKIFILDVAKMYEMWHNKVIEEYDEKQQEIIKLGALMMISKKEEFYKCIKELKAPSKVKRSLREIVERLNDNMDIKLRYYNWEEEQDMINRGIIKEMQQQMEKEMQQKMEKEMQQKMEKKLENEIAKTKKKAMKKGQEKGSIKERKTIISKLVESGMTKEKISEITEISLEEINKLLNN